MTNIRYGKGCVIFPSLDLVQALNALVCSALCNVLYPDLKSFGRKCAHPSKLFEERSQKKNTIQNVLQLIPFYMFFSKPVRLLVVSKEQAVNFLMILDPKRKSSKSLSILPSTLNKNLNKSTICFAAALCQLHVQCACKTTNANFCKPSTRLRQLGNKMSMETSFRQHEAKLLAPKDRDT